MSLLKKIYKHHAAYYKNQNAQHSKTSTIKKILILSFVSVPYFSILYYGALTSSNTIVSKSELIINSSILSTILFTLCYLLFNKWKFVMSIITNLIIYIIHSIVYISLILIHINYLSLDENYKTTKLEVIEWTVSMGRSTNTNAKVRLNNKESYLKFKGDLTKDSKQTSNLIAEVNTGILGYAYVRSFKLDIAEQ